MSADRTTCWAVTGPTGAGKSRLCELLAARGAVIIEADRVAHALLDRPAEQAALVAAFGDRILSDAGAVDRGALGARVFADPAARQVLDGIMHPPLAAVLGARLAAARLIRSPLVILEAAVYFLLPGPPPVDLTVAVTAPPDARLARLIAKGLAPAAAAARMAAQTHLEPSWQLADRVLDNAGSQAILAAQVDDLWRACRASRTQDG